MLRDEHIPLLINAVMFIADDDDENDSRDEDDDENQLPPINVEYWRRLGDPTFRRHFRMDRCVFELLIVEVGRHMEATNRIIRQGMPLDIALMMTLWILATPDSFRSVGVKFGKHGGSVHNQYKTMIQVLQELRFVAWPSPVELANISRQFEHMYQYPGVGGCIDGSYVTTYKPSEQPQRYVNRHHDYAVILQAVCDHDLLFRDVYVGQPGAVGDARTFQRSPLCRMMFENEEILRDKHLLGDGAYQITSKLLTPYRDNGNLTRRQRDHNYFLSRCRSCIERAYARLKGKWRSLKFFPTKHLEYLNDSIMASIVLHNFIILEGYGYEGEYRVEEHDDHANHDADDPDDPAAAADNRDGGGNFNFHEAYRRARAEGEQKRAYISVLLSAEQ